MTPLKIWFPAIVLMLAAAPVTVLHGQERVPAEPPARMQPAPTEAREKLTRFQGGVGVPIGVPVGDFGKNVDLAGGISGYFDVGLGKGVVSVGGEVAYLSYGQESREVDLSVLIPDLPGVTATVNTDNAVLLFLGRVRAQRPEGRWRPYVDGLFGFSDIYTKTSIEGTGSCDGYSCSTGLEATNLRDFAPSFGGGAGVMVGFGKAPHIVKLDMSVRYLRGGEADYLIKGAIHREGGQALLDISHSRTDMVLVYIGVAFGR